MIHIKRMGIHSQHDYNFYIDRPNGYDCFLLLLVKSPALFYIGDHKYYVAPNTIILYKPHQPHRYQAIGDTYINDWIQFEIIGEPSTKYLTLSDAPLFLHQSVYFDNLHAIIGEEFYSNDPHKELIITRLMEVLLTKLPQDLKPHSFQPMQHNLIELRKDIYSNPSKEWSIPLLAQQLHISEGYLHTIYKEYFGVTCMNDVIQSRVHYSKDLLKNTTLTIEEISHLSGYHYQEHFIRQFKKYTGNTPLTYRKMNKKD